MSGDRVHALGTCVVCSNSELVFSALREPHRIIIECLECLTGYSDPLDLQRSAVLRMEEVVARPAIRPEVEDAGYDSLIDF